MSFFCLERFIKTPKLLFIDKFNSLTINPTYSGFGCQSLYLGIKKLLLETNVNGVMILEREAE